MSAYYNENNPFAAEWLRALIEEGLIAAGDVDSRSIEEVSARDLDCYTQVHLFAGIGGWSGALRLAGVSDDEPCWTGSCPCQPFSVAGKLAGPRDRRHLWPHMRRLLEECHPPKIFGEQVASRAGREWFAGVRSDLETLGYAVGAADLCAAGVGAPHIRQRLWWVADADGEGCEHSEQRDVASTRGLSTSSGQDALRCGPLCGVVDPDRERLSSAISEAPVVNAKLEWPGWDEFDAIDCADGWVRRVEPGTFPLAYGVPGRVGRLRAYGNAIVPQVAAVFIRATL